MRTFWIYFFIFLVMCILTQLFLYFSAPEKYTFDIVHGAGYLGIICLSALLTSYILRKRKYSLKEKANL